MTDQDGKIIMEQDYLPFGGDLPKVGQVEVYNEIGMEYKYTGQNEVVSIGLYYYGARYYDPAIGRFITEDSYPGEMNNPQSQHLYVYVMNNPLRYIDPTGHMATPVLYNGGGGGSWNEDDSAGGIDKPTGGNKPKDNNTDIESKNVHIYSIDYTGSYEELKEKIELKEWFAPEVVEMIEIYSKTADEEDFNDYLNFAFECRGGYVPDLANIDRFSYEQEPENLIPITVGVSGNIWFYGFSAKLDIISLDADISKHFIPTGGVGISFLDISIGSGDIETSFGAIKYSSIGLLWDIKQDGGIEFKGIAFHIGPGVSLPVNLDIKIPEEAPPFPGL